MLTGIMNISKKNLSSFLFVAEEKVGYSYNTFFLTFPRFKFYNCIITDCKSSKTYLIRNSLLHMQIKAEKNVKIC